MFGNPAQLMSKVKTGLQDLVTKPSEGLVQGPLETGAGLILGVGSLVKNTLQGTLGSF